MRCKKCYYSLKELTGPPHRCPECGRAFDPNDQSTFFSMQDAALHRSLEIQSHFILGGWVILLVLFLVSRITPTAFFDFRLIGGALTIALFFWQTWVSQRQRRLINALLPERRDADSSAPLP